MTKPKRAAAPKNAVLYVRVPSETKDDVTRWAEKLDLSQEQLVRRVLREWLEARQ